MTLHFVGDTLDKARSHYLAETGKLVQLMRGIYAEPGDDIDSMVLSHAIRIAQYLYPSTYLSAASAVLLAPSRDGRLYLSGRRTQRTRIRGLEILQNKAPSNPSLGNAVVADSMGEFRIDVSSMRQRFLEAFRIRSEHASSIDPAMREAIAGRLIEEYGTAKAASDAVWALARENEWIKEGEGAERFLMRTPAAVEARNEASLNLVVAWHGNPIGRLTHDGFEWRWTLTDPSIPNLIRQTTPGRLPPFIVSLLPEGWLESVLHDRNERDMLRSGKRYLSNISIVEHPTELASLPQDVLLTRLSRYMDDNVFTGRYAGPGKTAIEQSFEQNLAHIYERPDTPRLSGVQIKAPMHLDSSGTLSPSTGTPFTHILKPAGTSGFEFLPLIEWTALTLGRAAGFSVPEAALVEMPDSMPPALLVERFDIRDGADDTRLIAMEDMCSVLDLAPEAKYSGTIERVGRAVRALSTEPDDDMLMLLKRALFAWFIADGDMHLKNMALLKIAEPGDSAFFSVRLAPLYDSVTTRVFPNLSRDRMALKLNGKDDRLTRNDFRSLAAILALKATVAEAAIEDMRMRIEAAAASFVPPAMFADNAGALAALGRVLDISRTRAASIEA